MRGGKGGFPKGFSQNISIWIPFFRAKTQKGDAQSKTEGSTLSP